MRIKRIIALGIVFLSGPAWAQPNMASGQRSYEVCAGCHGFLGEGNELVLAPRIAGLEPWYLERQIQNFADGIRGNEADDVNGHRMALMAQAIVNARELSDLTAYISSLPPFDVRTEGTNVNSSATTNNYVLCATCHGADGSGNETLGAPDLLSLEEWYFVEQLRLYAEGLRGTHAADALGRQMVAIAASFDTDEERRALAASVRALDR